MSQSAEHEANSSPEISVGGARGRRARERRTSLSNAHTFMLLGLLAFALGLSNLWYGFDRGARYERLLTDAQHMSATPPSDFNREQHNRYVLRLETRLGFFNTAADGGTVLIFLGVLLAGYGYLIWARQHD